jgi:hypothetical protein
MTKPTTKDIIWKTLSGAPIEIHDETSNTVVSGKIWELVVVRIKGDYIGSREIGAGNLVSAYNLANTMHIEQGLEGLKIYQFKEILDELAAERLIRRRPELVRQKFKVVE